MPVESDTPPAPGAAPKNPEPAQSMDDLRAEFAAKLESQSQSFRRQLEKLKPKEVEAPEELTLKQQLANVQKQLRDKDESEAQTRRQSAIETAIRSKGIEGAGFEDALAAVMHYHGKDIKISGDKNRTIYTDPDTAVEMPVEEFLDKKFLTGARKDRYTASPTKGGGKIERPGARGAGDRPAYMDLTPDERNKMTPLQQQQYAAEDYARSKRK